MFATDVTDAYPSRVGDRPEFLPRRDPVVYGAPAEDGGGPLTARQLRSFEENGFLVLPGFLSEEEVQACWVEVNRLRESETIKRRPESIVEPEGDDLRSLFSVHSVSPFLGDVAADERIASMALQILGSDVYLHQSRINLKPGFAGKEFAWHSDFETWHVEDGMPRMRCVSCSILLTPNYEVNGPLMLVPGSHKQYVTCVGRTPESHYKTSLRRQEFGVPDAESLTRLIDEGGGIETATGPAGTIILFDCNTIHGSSGNMTPYPRSNLFFVYNSVENRLEAPFCGLDPRPEFIASREHCEPLTLRRVGYRVKW